MQVLSGIGHNFMVQKHDSTRHALGFRLELS